MANDDQFGGTDAEYDGLVNQLMEAVTLTANVTAWGIALTVTAPGALLLADWTAKYKITKNKSTSTKVDRGKTEIAKTKLTKWLRPFVKKWIYLNTLMDDGDVTTCGLRPHSTTKTKIGKPITTPSMEMKAGNAPDVKSFYRQQPDTLGVSKRGKEKGATQVMTAIFICVEIPPATEGGAVTYATPPDSPNDFGRFDIGTRSPMILEFNDSLSGLFFYTASCWVTAKGIKGDWSTVQKFRIP